MNAKLNKIYFDYNSTMPMLPSVRQAVLDIMSEPLNPSSLHGFGRNAKNIIDSARVEIAKSVGVDDSYAVVFTSSGTEANNLAIKGLDGYKIITTAIEHPSVLYTVGEGIIPVDRNGIIDLEIFEKSISNIKGDFLVSIQFASNETGVIQPIKDAAESVHKYGGIIHTDATQALGRIDFDALNLGVDMITVSSHKIGGPMGAAALIFRKDIPLKSIMRGGGQEYRFRPGTQNTASIKGFGVAASEIKLLLATQQRVKRLRDKLQTKISKISPHSIVFGSDAPRLPNTLSISMPGVESHTQVISFDMDGFAVSAGAACSAGVVGLPHVHMAMGYDEKIASTALRISLGLHNTEDEVDMFIKSWESLYYKTLNK
jgi:cysteine desulfurase